MADVFLSYRREDRSAVEQIAARLRQLRLTVWFDASMSAGESFNDEIDREARAANVILVCWSPAARESRWVKAEAMVGFEHDKLAAAYVAGPDAFSPPTPFNTVHAEDLRSWLASPSDAHAAWRSVLRRIGRLCRRGDIVDWGALDGQASAIELRDWVRVHADSPLFQSVDALLRAREAQDVGRMRLELDTRERRAREHAEERARNKSSLPAHKVSRSQWVLWVALLLAIGGAGILLGEFTSKSDQRSLALPAVAPPTFGQFTGMWIADSPEECGGDLAMLRLSHRSPTSELGRTYAHYSSDGQIWREVFSGHSRIVGTQLLVDRGTRSVIFDLQADGLRDPAGCLYKRAT